MSLTREMHLRTSDGIGYNAQEDEMQRRYLEILTNEKPRLEDAPRIGRDFLKDHPDYLA